MQQRTCAPWELTLRRFVRARALPPALLRKAKPGAQVPAQLLGEIRPPSIGWSDRAEQGPLGAPPSEGKWGLKLLENFTRLVGRGRR